jgi:protein gp37
MADNSKIEWTDATWNPIVGCSVLSPGCTNCYAMRQAPRTDELSIGAPWAGATGKLTQSSKGGPVWTGAIRFVERRLDQPLRWRAPRKIFVNSMGDLFHENVPDEWIDRVFAVMALAPQHTFQALTKRAERMRNYCLGASDADRRVWAAANEIMDTIWALAQHGASWGGETPWPLRNVWLGVSVEDQQRADERIPLLLETPAAEHFISAEPLLGPLDIRQWLGPREIKGPDCYWLDWVIAGGESGPGARAMHRDWAQSLRDQCVAAAVPFFFKQHGEWIDADEWLDGLVCSIAKNGELWKPDRPLNYTDAAWLAESTGRGHCYEHQSDGTTLIRVGKKAAGRLLDGREWSEFPA